MKKSLEYRHVLKSVKKVRKKKSVMKKAKTPLKKKKKLERYEALEHPRKEAERLNPDWLKGLNAQQKKQERS